MKQFLFILLFSIQAFSLPLFKTDSIQVKTARVTTLTAGSVKSSAGGDLINGVPDSSAKCHIADTALHVTSVGTSDSSRASHISDTILCSLPWQRIYQSSTDTSYWTLGIKSNHGFFGALFGNATTATTADTARSAGQASKLITARAIGGTSFDGTANIIPDTAAKANHSESSDTSLKYDNRYLGLHGTADSSIKANHSESSDTSLKTDNRYGTPWDSAGNIPDSLKKKITFGVTKHDSAFFTGGTRIYKDGSVNVSPAADIGVTVTNTSTSATAADKCALYGGITWTPSGNSTARLYGLNFSPAIVGDKNIVGAAGVLGRVVVNAGSGALGDVTPLWGNLEITGSSTRTFTNYYGIKSDISNAGSALTGTNAYQLLLPDYTAALTASNKYGIYQLGNIPNTLNGSLTVNNNIVTQTTGQSVITRYNNADTYRNVFTFNSVLGPVLQLGNAYYNYIVAGNSAAGGMLKIIVNNSTDCASGTTLDGITAMEINATGAILVPNLTAGGIVKAAAGTGLLSAAALSAVECAAAVSGTENTFAMFTNSNVVGNSTITQSGANVQIGNYSVGPEVTIAAGDYTSLLNFYNVNNTQGSYIEAVPQLKGGKIRFGARWDDNEDKIFFDMAQSSAGASYDVKVGIGVAGDSTLDVHGTAGAGSLNVDGNARIGGKLNATADSTIGAARAAKLTTARTIGGTSFDGTSNIVPDSAEGAHHLHGGDVEASNVDISSNSAIPLIVSGYSKTPKLQFQCSGSATVGTLAATSDQDTLGGMTAYGVNVTDDARLNGGGIINRQSGTVAASGIKTQWEILARGGQGQSDGTVLVKSDTVNISQILDVAAKLKGTDFEFNPEGYANCWINGDSTNVLTIKTNVNIISKDSLRLLSADMTDSTIRLGHTTQSNGTVFKKNYMATSVGVDVASGATITPTGMIFHVTGTTAIDSILLPFAGFTGTITIIPDDLWTWTTSGNIGAAGQVYASTIGGTLTMTYDGTKWRPSYR